MSFFEIFYEITHTTLLYWKYRVLHSKEGKHSTQFPCNSLLQGPCLESWDNNTIIWEGNILLHDLKVFTTDANKAYWENNVYDINESQHPLHATDGIFSEGIKQSIKNESTSLPSVIKVVIDVAITFKSSIKTPWNSALYLKKHLNTFNSVL